MPLPTIRKGGGASIVGGGGGGEGGGEGEGGGGGGEHVHVVGVQVAGTGIKDRGVGGAIQLVGGVVRGEKDLFYLREGEREGGREGGRGREMERSELHTDPNLD